MVNAKIRYFKRDNQKSSLRIRPSVGGQDIVAEINVSPATVRALKAEIGLMRAFPDYNAHPEGFEEASEAMIGRYAPDLACALEAVRESPEQRPSLLAVRGLQVATSPAPTPVDGIVVQADVAVEAALLAGVTRHMGLVGTAFASENGGQLLRAVCPVEAVTNTASSQGAKADLLSHSDNNHLPIPASSDRHPDPAPPAMNPYQSFVAITPDAANPMRVRMNRDVFANLDPRGGDPWALRQFHLLFEPKFDFLSPPSHGEGRVIERMPILVERNDGREGFAMRFHGGTTRGATPEAEEALQLLKHAIQRTPEEVIYSHRGDIVSYFNMGVTHRREPFAARYDGTDRYYLRLYGNRPEDVLRWRAGMGPNGRVMR